MLMRFRPSLRVQGSERAVIDDWRLLVVLLESLCCVEYVGCGDLCI